MYKALATQDLSDMDETALPPVALLSYLKDRKDTNPDEIPYVELGVLCVPDWST